MIKGRPENTTGPNDRDYIGQYNKTKVLGDAASMVKWARIQAGLTKKDLAIKAGVSPSTISRIELAEISVRQTTIFKIIEACGLKPELMVKPGGE